MMQSLSWISLFPELEALTDTANFLKQQGKVDAVLPDYSPYVSAKFLPN